VKRAGKTALFTFKPLQVEPVGAKPQQRAESIQGQINQLERPPRDEVLMQLICEGVKQNEGDGFDKWPASGSLALPERPREQERQYRVFDYV